MGMHDEHICDRYLEYKRCAGRMNKRGWEMVWKGEDRTADKFFEAESLYRSDMQRLLGLMDEDERRSVQNEKA